MSPFIHVFVLVLIFATSQIVKSAVDPSPPESPPPDATKFSFKRNNGSLSVKISMEKTECVAKAAPTSTVKPGLHGPEAGLKILGDKENPAKSCSEVENSGTAHINTTAGVIKVKCDVDNRGTCLLVKDKIEQENLTNSTSIALGEELWLSQTKFDVQSLFNKVAGKLGVDIPQLKYFLSTSYYISQTIRYYYSEGDNEITPEDANVNSLKGLLWNDHLVGSEITKEMPLAFTVYDGPCWEAEPNESEKWLCTDIHLETHSYHNRLPVKDFYIGDIIRKSDKVQKLYFELVDLCFYEFNLD